VRNNYEDKQGSNYQHNSAYFRILKPIPDTGYEVRDAVQNTFDCHVVPSRRFSVSMVLSICFGLFT
jgi:hypothetical protein